jgi:hypothetical protein
LIEEKHVNAEQFIVSHFLIKPAYLCDIFEKLNLLNTALQGNETHILQLFDKVTTFMRKLDLWKKKLQEENGKTDSFPQLKRFLEENEVQLTTDLKSLFTDHLSLMKSHFEKYFPEDFEQHNWIRDPFRAELPPSFTTTEQEQLIDLSSDSTLRIRFPSMSLPGFCRSVRREYPEISCKALRVLIPFTTSYLYEAGFSAVVVIKSKYRSKINVEKEMRVAVSKMLPCFELLCHGKQAHLSH